MKPKNPPRRRVVRRRTLGGNGSAMSALFCYKRAPNGENVEHTPQVQGCWERGRCSSPGCIVGRPEITNDTREMRVRIDEREGRLHDLVRHGCC